MQIEEAKKILKGMFYNDNGEKMHYIDFSDSYGDEWGGYTLPEYIEAIETVLNELEMAEKVIDKRNEEKLELAEMIFTKSKVIDEMAKELRYQLAQRGDLYCVNFCENKKKCNINNCIEGIKQYFYKKVRNGK